jgi:hypothetical protein
MKKRILLILLFISTNVFAGAWTDWAVPTQVDIERGNGFMVYGAFGNAGGCTVADKFYVKSDHPQYKEIYSAVLAAFSAKKSVRAYTHSCEAVTWYSVSTTTYNILSLGGTLNIKD